MNEAFLWGVATSGYQSEGGYNQPGQPHNNWAEWEQRGRVQRTGGGPRFWARYAEDFALARGLGLNAFRLGIEWARVQPSFDTDTIPAPDWDESALDGYAQRLAGCRAAGMEPIVTLHHFTHPAWLGIDAWLLPPTVDYFEAYVRHTVREINRRLVERHGQPPLRTFITLNEPNMLVLNSYFGHQFPAKAMSGSHAMLRAYNHLLAAHVRAYNAIHDLYEEAGWERPRVSLNTFCSDLYWNDKFIWDLLASRELGIGFDQLGRFLLRGETQLQRAVGNADLPFNRNLIWHLGNAVKFLAARLGRRQVIPENFETFLHELARSKRARLFDFIGLDYYDPFFGHLFRLPTFHDLEFPSHGLRDWLMDGMSAKWWNWRCLPQGLPLFARFYSETLFNRPVLIAENGMAMRRKFDNQIVSAREDGLTRSDFLRAHVREVMHAVKEGVPIIGYLHWSLTDNYEWGSFTPRFGLYSLDYAAEAERKDRDQHDDCPSATYRELIRHARGLG
ncbi:MAG TPA: family 1 glycosylhydrolase [Chthoniobacterales bacterium]